MTFDSYPIEDYLDPSDRFSRPLWDPVGIVVDRMPERERPAAWNEMLRVWTTRLAEDLGGQYGARETDQFFVVAATDDQCLDRLAAFVERCRTRLIASLPANASLAAPGKQVVIAFAGREQYYDYIAAYYDEGEYGGSGGMHIRDGYPHVAALGRRFHEFEATIAHELTHAACHALDLPVWLEEGLTQLNEIQIAGRQPLVIDDEVASEQKAFWREEGLEDYWQGVGFHRADEGQKLSYQLSEILLRLLYEDFRPRWFGFDQEPRRKLLAFLGAAKASDCGQASAEQHLGMSVGTLAGRFLGPGGWEPGL